MTTDSGPTTTTERRWLRAALAVYLIALAFMVFLPSREAGAVNGFVGVIAGWVAFFGLPVGQAAVGIEFGANVVMFVPFGGLIRLLGPRTWFWWRMLFMGPLHHPSSSLLSY